MLRDSGLINRKLFIFIFCKRLSFRAIKKKNRLDSRRNQIKLSALTTLGGCSLSPELRALFISGTATEEQNGRGTVLRICERLFLLLPSDSSARAQRTCRNGPAAGLENNLARAGKRTVPENRTNQPIGWRSGYSLPALPFVRPASLPLLYQRSRRRRVAPAATGTSGPAARRRRRGVAPSLKVALRAISFRNPDALGGSSSRSHRRATFDRIAPCWDGAPGSPAAERASRSG